MAKLSDRNNLFHKILTIFFNKKTCKFVKMLKIYVSIEYKKMTCNSTHHAHSGFFIKKLLSTQTQCAEIVKREPLEIDLTQERPDLFKYFKLNSLKARC